MYPDSETLRNRRIRVLLDNTKYYWLSSIALGLLSLLILSLVNLSFGNLLNAVYVISLGLLGLYSVYFSKKQIRKAPLWSPELWFLCLVAANGMLWGIVGRNDGIFLTLAIAQAALAGLFLASHSRLSAVSITLTALIPLPFLYLNQSPALFTVFVPLMSLIAFISYRGHKLMVRTLRNELESERLTSLLTQNQSELQEKIKRRTQQLEMTNQRLINEVELRKEVNQALILSEEHLNLAMTASGIGFWDWDIAKRKVYHSETKRFFGKEESLEDENFSLLDRVYAEDLPYIRRLLIRHLQDKSTFYQARYRITLPDSNKLRWLEDSGKITERDQNGRAIRMIGTRRDITKDMQLQEELSLSSSLFNNSSEGVFILDDQQRFRTCNRAFCKIFSRQKGEFIDMPLFRVIRTDQSDQILHSVAHNDKWYGEIVAARHSDERFPIHLTLSAIRRDDGSIAHYLGICRDQSESDQNEREIKYLNNYDKLTGLFNRSYFHQLLNQFQDHKPLAVNNYAVCVLNLDRFKSVNESLGIEVGDQLLKDLSARLSNFSDPVRQVARMSSDEFALIIEYEKDQDKLNLTLANLLSEISRPFLVGDHELIVTASMGVCFVQEGNLTQLLNQAIAAMNQARYKGGNNFQFYHQKLATTPLERLQLEKAMRKAIVNHEFSVDYQPKLNLLTGIIDSVEALVRWMHPQKGVIAPEDFIPLAEETGLISAIGEQVLNKACSEAATWRDRGFGDISVSVNLSFHQIRRDDLYDVVQNALVTSSLPAEYLELELTESMLMEDISHAQDFLNQLRSLGVRLALDDFGTGYSSLSYLKRLPINTLKIDRSFVNEARTGESSPIVEAIMAMSESLQLSVVAEGVETKEQLEYLKNLGCDYAQGYIISRALPSSEILPLIQHSNLQTLSQSSESVH
jgi:diguanylate cyclase (GGDEF)-like protein/PAS domain S-box-containing protein